MTLGEVTESDNTIAYNSMFFYQQKAQNKEDNHVYERSNTDEALHAKCRASGFYLKQKAKETAMVQGNTRGKSTLTVFI